MTLTINCQAFCGWHAYPRKRGTSRNAGTWHCVPRDETMQIYWFSRAFFAWNVKAHVPKCMYLMGSAKSVCCLKVAEACAKPQGDFPMMEGIVGMWQIRPEAKNATATSYKENPKRPPKKSTYTIQRRATKWATKLKPVWWPPVSL